MTQPYIVCTVNDNSILGAHEKENWDDAVSLAVKLVMEMQDMESETEVRQEVEDSARWDHGSPESELSVQIIQAETSDCN